jgi:hypothetical protein
MIGPKIRPTPAVPWRCAQKSPSRIATVSGMTIGRAEDDHRGQPADARPLRLEPRGHEGEQREDPPLAVVVGAHDEREVLQRHDHRQRPEHERQNAEHVRRRGCETVGAGHRLAHRVERARPDVAEDDPEREQHQAAARRERMMRRARAFPRGLGGKWLGDVTHPDGS